MIVDLKSIFNVLVNNKYFTQNTHLVRNLLNPRFIIIFAIASDSLTPQPVLGCTRIATPALRESEIPILVKSGREADGVVGGEEALLAEGVEVEGATVVSGLER